MVRIWVSDDKKSLRRCRRFCGITFLFVMMYHLLAAEFNAWRDKIAGIIIVVIVAFGAFCMFAGYTGSCCCCCVLVEVIVLVLQMMQFKHCCGAGLDLSRAARRWLLPSASLRGSWLLLQALRRHLLSPGHFVLILIMMMEKVTWRHGRWCTDPVARRFKYGAWIMQLFLLLGGPIMLQISTLVTFLLSFLQWEWAACRCSAAALWWCIDKFVATGQSYIVLELLTAKIKARVISVAILLLLHLLLLWMLMKGLVQKLFVLLVVLDTERHLLAHSLIDVSFWSTDSQIDRSVYFWI